MTNRYARWLRLVISMAMTSFERYGEKPKIPVLMLLEEFNVLGHMPVIETAAGQIAGSGVKLWTVLQDLGQIQRHYQKSWETFIGNAGLLTFFGNSDWRTLNYSSTKAWRHMLVERGSRSNVALYGGANAMQEDIRETPLLHTHDREAVRARGRAHPGRRRRTQSVRDAACDYYEDVMFKGLITPVCFGALSQRELVRRVYTPFQAVFLSYAEVRMVALVAFVSRSYPDQLNLCKKSPAQR